MDDITELESRIAAALDRIRYGVSRLPTAGAGEELTRKAARAEALEAELEEEKTANAQLEERVRALKDRQDTRVATLEAEVTAQRGRLGALDIDLQKLRQANADLRDINARLREAMAEGVAEPHLINKAMLAELEALRATREADAAEIRTVLGELKPLIAKEG